MKNADLPWPSSHLRTQHAAVLGGGAWGTALAAALQRSRYQTRLWCRRAATVRQINVDKRNDDYLPGIRLPEGLTASTELTEVVRGASLVVLAVPSSSLLDVARQLARHLPSQVPVLVASKGVERDTGALMTEVVKRAMPGVRVGVISGPSFAADVARGEPTALTLAFKGSNGVDRDMSQFVGQLKKRMQEAAVRLELTDDVAGAQVGGALKNVVAIACGMAAGRGMGANTRAAIVSRGMSDMLRLTLALGGKAETLLTSCGVGDTMLTCTSEQSRNYRFGLRLGQGTGDAGDDKLVEGAINAQTVLALEERLGLSLGTVSAVRDMVQGRISVDAALQRILHGTDQAPRTPPSLPGLHDERLSSLAEPSSARPSLLMGGQ